MDSSLPPALRTALQEELACIVIGLMMSTTLYGITLLQSYFYYRMYRRDSLQLKLLVCVLLVIDSLTTIFMAHVLYTYTVTDIGELLKVTQVLWSLSLDQGFAVVSSFIVQSYFGHRLWIFSRKNKILVVSIFLLALANLGGGLALMVDMFIHPDVSYFATVRTRILAGICGSSSLCDILIAGGLCYYLETGRSGMKKTDTIVDKLMVYAVNRGIVTTVCQLMHLILIVALPGHVYFFPFAMIESKVYVNALIATLNVRQSLSEGGSIALSPTAYDTEAINTDPQAYGGGSVTTIGFASASDAHKQDSIDKGLPVI